jgi:hypothetical protein
VRRLPSDCTYEAQKRAQNSGTLRTGVVPDLNFWGTADLIAEGDYVLGRWDGGGTHTGPAFGDFLVGSLPAATGRTMRFTGTTVLRLKDSQIAEEIGLDDGVTALRQLGLIAAAPDCGRISLRLEELQYVLGI